MINMGAGNSLPNLVRKKEGKVVMGTRPNRIMISDCIYWVEIMEEEEEKLKTKEKNNSKLCHRN